MRAHIQDIEVGNILMKGDIIHLIETSLEENEESPIISSCHKAHTIAVQNGMGRSKPNLFTPEQDTKKMQITKFRSEHIDIINVFRS